jgi:hypothetical protein
VIVRAALYAARFWYQLALCSYLFLAKKSLMQIASALRSKSD